MSLSWGGLGKALSQAAAGLSHTQKLMAQIGLAMKGQTIRRFAKGAGPDGQPWKKSRRAGAEGGLTLVDTARLQSSISFSATPLDVQVGSNVVYARIHQLGGQAGRGRKITLPARPYLGLSEDDREEIEALAAAYLKGLFK